MRAFPARDIRQPSPLLNARSHRAHSISVFPAAHSALPAAARPAANSPAVGSSTHALLALPRSPQPTHTQPPSSPHLANVLDFPSVWPPSSLSRAAPIAALREIG